MKKKSLSGKARRLVPRTRSRTKKPKQASMRETISKMQESIDEIHHAVIRIENEQVPAIKAIGEGLSLTNERLDRFEKNVNQCLDVVDRHLTSVEGQVIGLREDVKEIKQTTGHTTSIVENHEGRLGAVESSIKEHIEKHA